MNLFPFVPLSSLRDGTNRDLLLNLALKKAEGETERERKGGVRRDTEMGGGGQKIQDIRRGERKVKSKKRAENRVREVRSRAKMEALWKTQLVHVEETEEHSRTDTKGVSMTLQELQSDTC